MELENNWLRYKELLLSTNREGINDLIEYLEHSDFKTAPASTIYHSAFEGGLCYHSLNVCDTLFKLNDLFNAGLDRNSMIIAALLHDLSKVNFYEKTVQNRKLYKPDGSKFDEFGKYDWVSVYVYKVKDSNNRFIGADHGTNSMLLASRFIKLTEDEAIAIINHHAGMDNNYVIKDLGAIYTKNHLAALLHHADSLSVYMME